jgi:Bacterial Ig domain
LSKNNEVQIDHLTPPSAFGATIITHGYVLGSVFPPWVQDMGAAVLNRAGRGRLLRFNAQSDELVDITNSTKSPGTSRVAIRQDVLQDPNGEQVIIVDWSHTANNTFANPEGHAEAVGHQLFSLMMGGASGFSGFIGSTSQRRPLHFIAHSFGTVVNSEAIQRLGLYGIPVRQMTTLDPHDWGEGGIIVDCEALLPDVHVWSNVERADNYYATAGGLSTLNPHGRDLFGAQNYNLTSFDGFGNASLHHSHANVHQYYHGTIDPSAIGSLVDGNEIKGSWYPTSPLRRGYTYSRVGSENYLSDFLDESTLRAGGDSLINPPNNSTRTNFGAEEDIGIDPPEAVFNGDFWLRVFGSEAGYSNAPNVEAPFGDARYAAKLDLGNDQFQTHLTHIPANATRITFKVFVENVGVFGGDDSLHVCFNGISLGPIAFQATQDFVLFERDVRNYAGQSGLIQFNLEGNGVLNSIVWVDEIKFSSAPPDTMPPTLAIAMPAANGTVVSNASLAVSGTASDNVAVTQVRVRVNTGSWNNAVLGVSWSATVQLSTGTNTIDAQSVDAAGNLSSIASRTITYTPPDTILPTVAITSPSTNGTMVANASLAVSGTASDNVAVTQVRVRVNTGPWNNAVLGVGWSATVQLSTGTNTIDAQSVDAAGNLSSIASRTITYTPPDTTLPLVAITSPTTNGTIVANASLLVSGTASDIVGVTAVYVRLNAGSWMTASGTVNWTTTVTLAQGSNTIEDVTAKSLN